jgi:hypothetical protein
MTSPSVEPGKQLDPRFESVASQSDDGELDDGKNSTNDVGCSEYTVVPDE